MLLEGKSAVITGAGSGVGRASALLFAAEGAHIVCADIRDDWANNTVRQIVIRGGTAVAQHCDVTDETDLIEAIEACVRLTGRLDIMFNNAGIGTPSPGLLMEDHTAADFARLFAVNVLGVYLGCKQAVLQFKRQGAGGVIVNTSSVAGLVGLGGIVYGASKGAVNQMTRGLAVECAQFGIRVNAICPGSIPETNFSVPSAEEGSVGLGEEAANLRAAMNPLGAPISAQDCAQAALFLASEYSRNITGILVPIDGGYLAK